MDANGAWGEEARKILSHVVYYQSQSFGIYQTTPSTIAISSWNPHQRGSRIQQYPSLATIPSPNLPPLTTNNPASPPPLASESKRQFHRHALASACQSLQKQRTLLAGKLGVVLGSMLLGLALHLKLNCL